MESSWSDGSLFADVRAAQIPCSPRESSAFGYRHAGTYRPRFRRIVFMQLGSSSWPYPHGETGWAAISSRVDFMRGNGPVADHAADLYRINQTHHCGRCPETVWFLPGKRAALACRHPPIFGETAVRQRWPFKPVSTQLQTRSENVFLAKPLMMTGSLPAKVKRSRRWLDATSPCY